MKLLSFLFLTMIGSFGSLQSSNPHNLNHIATVLFLSSLQQSEPKVQEVLPHVFDPLQRTIVPKHKKCPLIKRKQKGYSQADRAHFQREMSKGKRNK